MTAKVVGVIGGSGLYEMAALMDTREVRLATPFGEPSDPYVVGRIGDVTLVFLARHGRGHRIPPHQINFRANIWGLKELGARWVVSVSAVGSMREEIVPGHIVIPDQFIDRTRLRPSTFFEDSVVAHVSLADPVCPVLAAALAESADAVQARVHRGGTYLCMEGPQFSTRAESHLYRSWGVSVIGMTNMPEAKLAREAELSYATVALATDYDCWHQSEEDVSIEAVLEIVHRNAETAQRIVADVAQRIPWQGEAPAAQRALEHAILTDRSRIPEATRARLALIAGRVLG